MSRIPTHTVEDAPAASRPLLQKIIQSTPTGRPANLHAQMAHSPAVLTAYTSLRAVLAELSTFDPKVGAALTLATAAGVGNGYMIRIASRLAHMNGWAEEQVTAMRTGTPDERRQDRRADRPSQGSGCEFGKRYRRHLEGRSASYKLLMIATLAVVPLLAVFKKSTAQSDDHAAIEL